MEIPELKEYPPMIEKILKREEFIERPPVLLDIGSAGSIHQKWKPVARYSHCIAFEADDRDLVPEIRETKNYRKLFVFNALVSDRASGEVEFHLTKSPHCSSLLPPDHERLKEWAFADLFEVQQVVRLVPVTLDSVLKETGADKVDWFKSDSQGIDLRLFESLGTERIDRVLVAEFEPGIIDAYKGEDKLWHLLKYMEELPFWVSDLVVKGSRRIRPDHLYAFPSILPRRVIQRAIRTSPGWGEITYFRSFREREDRLDKRDYLLGFVISLIEKQFGFAYEIASEGKVRFGDSVFDEMSRCAMSRIRREFVKLPFAYASDIFRITWEQAKKMLS